MDFATVRNGPPDDREALYHEVDVEVASGVPLLSFGLSLRVEVRTVHDHFKALGATPVTQKSVIRKAPHAVRYHSRRPTDLKRAEDARQALSKILQKKLARRSTTRCLT